MTAFDRRRAFDRRDFLKLCGAGALTAGVVPGARLAFGATNSNNYDTLIVVFLRGGCDGLSMIPPIGGNDRGYYEAARPDIRIPISGQYAAYPLANSGAGWGLHPRAPQLRDLYQSGKLAVVLGAGMPAPVTRSHFDAQQTMELGTPGQTGIGSGWLTRYLTSASLPANVTIPALSAGSLTSTSLIASAESITMSDGGDFRVDSSAWSWNAADHYNPTPPTGFRGLVETLPDLWNGSTALDAAGRQTLDALSIIRPMDFDAYAGANGSAYGTDGFSNQLKMIAQLIKADLGVRVVTIDLASWDTHEGQGVPNGGYDRYGNMVESLSTGLGAFYTDLAGAGANNFASRTSIVVMSEFGRRLRGNGSSGTDHGYGNMMMVLGGSVNGGSVYGLSEFAGLSGSALFEGEDVMVTTDLRRVLSEALIRRMQNNHLGSIFPGYANYSPMGIFQGADIPPDYTGGGDHVFGNSFE